MIMMMPSAPRLATLVLLGCGLVPAWLVIANPVETVMGTAPECKILELTTAGEWRIAIAGVTRAVRLRGVVVPPETVAEVNGLLERLRHDGAATRCSVAGADAASVAPATVEYRAWRDKSGDVWEDLAATLLDQGLARVATPDGANVEEYRARERKAREAGRGIWAKERKR